MAFTDLLKLLSTRRNEYMFIPSSIDSEEEPTLQTPYGLKLVMHNTNSVLVQLADNTEKPISEGGIHYSYRICPDYQTSFAWYDTSWPQNPPDEYHVDDDILEQRYPYWNKTYQTWVRQYEEHFEALEYHPLGYAAELFPDILDRVSWELEGFLLSCWLSLQLDVHAVKYKPNRVVYEVEKNKLNIVATKFLGDLSNFVGMRDSVPS